MRSKLNIAPHSFKRDSAYIRQKAEDIIRWLDAYDKNGWGDELRLMYVDVIATSLKKRSDRAHRRYLAKQESIGRG